MSRGYDDEDYGDYDNDYDDTVEYVRKVKDQLKGIPGVKVTDAQIVRKLEETNYDIKKTAAFFKPKETKASAPKTAAPKVAPKSASTGIVPANVDKSKLAPPPPQAAAPSAECPPPPAHVAKGEMLLSDDEEVAAAAVGALTLDPTAAAGKQALTMVVTGHVDAGKSTLVGHLLYKCGQVTQRTMHKYEKDSKAIGKASFSLAWVTDESQSEREHGVTIDVAERVLQTQNRVVTILDTPGHRDFIPNMIKGASQADVALLVVPAVDGEFESSMKDNAQTREHATLLKALGVSQVIVVVNKMDSTSPEPWSQARCVEIDAAMRSLLCNEMHFNEKHIRVVPLSGLTGQNIVKLDEVCPLKRWYSGPTLLEAIDSFLVPTRSWQKPLRAVVQEVVSSDPSRARCELEVCVLQGKLRTDRSVAFYDTSKRPQFTAATPVSAAASGVGVASKVGGHAEGDVAAGKEGEAAHGKYTAATATVLAHNGAPPCEGEHSSAGDAGTVLKAGERGRISLSNKHLKGMEMGIKEGTVLFKGPSVPSVCQTFKATVSTMAHMQRPIIPGSCFELYLFGTEVQCQVAKLHSMVVPDSTGRAGSVEDNIVKKPKCVPAAAHAVVTITLDTPILIESVKDCRALGRFALRAQGKTVAVGVCEKTS